MTAHNIVSPTDEDIRQLKEELNAKRRIAEFSQLKNDLADITYKTVNLPNEFDGAMQIVDTDKVLQTKRSKNGVFDLLADRAKRMFSIRPIIGHLISLLIAATVLFFIFNEIDLSWFAKYEKYLSIFIQIGAAITIIKSATRSLILPSTALVFGAVAAHSLGAHETLFHFNKAFYEYMCIAGIIGLGISIFSID